MSSHVANSESAIQAQIRQAVNQLGYCRLVRNNTGRAETIKGDWITYGLGVGGADLVGWVQMPNGYARVLAVEVKALKGRASDEQRAWLTSVNKNGGVAGICRSVAQAVELASRGRAGEFFTGWGPF